MTRVAVLGMGRMGQVAAIRLLDTGHDVYAWNRTLGKTAEVVDHGGRAPADLASTIAEAEIVITVLSDDDAVRSVVLGEDGVADALGDRLFIDASTVSPQMCKELAERIDRYLALPIAGSPAALREGKAICLAGGPGELVDEAGPVITSLSISHHRYARAEQAAVAKVANNTLLLVALAGLAETVAVARVGGLTDAQLHELLDTSAMVAPGVRNRLGAVIDGDGPIWWNIDLAVKDAGLALEVARGGGPAVPVLLAASERYDAAASRGLGDEDIALIGRLYADR